MKRRYNEEEGYYYYDWEDIIEYDKKQKEYYKLKLENKIKNDPENEFWYGIKIGTNVLVSNDNINWENKQFYSREVESGIYIVKAYDKKDFSRLNGFIPKHYISDGCESDRTVATLHKQEIQLECYKYSKIDKMNIYNINDYRGDIEYEKHLKIKEYANSI